MERIKSRAILILTGVLLAASQTVAAGTPATNLTLTIAVRNYARVDPETLAGAESVAARIFQKAGVATRWLEVSIDLRPSDYQVQVSIIPRAMADRLGFPNNVMGIAPGMGADRQMVYVFYDRVEALAQRQVLALMAGDIGWRATRDQILGHMVAHEIGHLLLNLSFHSASGIMRGNWDQTDLQDVAFGKLLFTPLQAAGLRAEVLRRAQQQEAMDLTGQP